MRSALRCVGLYPAAIDGTAGVACVQILSPRPGGNHSFGPLDCRRRQKHHHHESRHVDDVGVRRDGTVVLDGPVLQPKTCCRAEKVEGIEFPVPQRDVHVSSNPSNDIPSQEFRSRNLLRGSR